MYCCHATKFSIQFVCYATNDVTISENQTGFSISHCENSIQKKKKETKITMAKKKMTKQERKKVEAEKAEALRIQQERERLTSNIEYSQ